MVQEPDEVLIPDETSIDNNSNNNVHKVVHRKPEGGKSWQEQLSQQVEEEHWQWTTLKRKKSPVFDNNAQYESELHGSLPKPEFFTRTHIEDNAAEEPAKLAQKPKAKAIEKTSKRAEDVGNNNAELNNSKIGSRSRSKCAVEIPQLELTKMKEIALQAKLEGGVLFVCQECQAAVATSRGQLGFHRRYPCLLFFCIFLNLMSILSFLFCISVLRTMFPHPAF